MNLLDERKTIENPTSIRIEWKSEVTSFAFFKKGSAESEKGEIVKLPQITFIPVQLAFRIGGYNNDKDCYLYSNTFTDFKTHIVTVKYAKGSGVVASGLYADIKEKIKGNDGKFQNVLYSVITHVNGKELPEPKYVEIIIAGAASAGLQNANQSIFSLIGKSITHTGHSQEKNGGIKYNAPTFEILPIEKEKLPIHVLEFAQKVQGYFKEYIELTQGVKHSVSQTEDTKAEYSPTPQPSKNTYPTLDDSFPTMADAPAFTDDDNSELPF